MNMNLQQARKRHPIISEECEPFAAMMIGKMWARSQAVKGDADLYHDSLRSLWWTVKMLDRLAILAETATHFSIAISNETRRTSVYIEAEIGIDPFDDPEWQWN